jgi:hypothetical protein
MRSKRRCAFGAALQAMLTCLCILTRYFRRAEKYNFPFPVCLCIENMTIMCLQTYEELPYYLSESDRDQAVLEVTSKVSDIRRRILKKDFKHYMDLLDPRLLVQDSPLNPENTFGVVRNSNTPSSKSMRPSSVPDQQPISVVPSQDAGRATGATTSPRVLAVGPGGHQSPVGEVPNSELVAPTSDSANFSTAGAEQEISVKGTPEKASKPASSEGSTMSPMLATLDRKNKK